MNSVRKILSIQIFHSFASGILGIALPIMMKSRQIDVVAVGFIFAAMPIIFQLGRMFFAVLSDFWGRKLFFMSNGLLAVISGLLYYVAHTPADYLFGKVVEGTKEGTLWAVNRACLLEECGGNWRVLVHLRTVVYVAYAAGSFIAGYLISWILFEGAMLLSAALGAFVMIIALTLKQGRKERFDFGKALRFLDFRRKSRTFNRFLILFLILGVSLGLVGGFVLTWYLDANGFSLEIIGLIFGAQILAAGFSAYLFSRTAKTSQLILLSGVFFAVVFLVLSMATPLLAAVLLIFYGAIQGVASIGQEAIATRISDKQSYGTDIGLLWTGFHITESFSLALTGILISIWGFTISFVLSAMTYLIFAVGAYLSFQD